MAAVETPACPRCGYDLSGEVARWERECPMEGVCTECGLGIVWADVLSDRLRPPGWSFEHARGWWVRRVPATLRRTCLPVSFWREMRMEHPVRVRRLLVALLAVLAATHVAFGTTTMLLWSWMELSWGWVGAAAPTVGVTGLVVYACREHWEMLVSPLVVSGWGGGLMRGPLVLSSFVALATGVVVMPLTFLLLPATFQRVRVRRVHLLRAFAYTLPFPALAGSVSAVGFAVAYATLSGGWWTRDLIGLTWLGAGVGLGVYWLSWLWVAWAYLRLPRAALVWAGLTAISGLSAAVAATFAWIDEGFMF